MPLDLSPIGEGGTLSKILQLTATEIAARIAAGDRAMTTEEAARATGLSPSTLTTHRSRGRGAPFFYLMGKARYWASDIAAFIATEAGKAPPAAPGSKIAA